MRGVRQTLQWCSAAPEQQSLQLTGGPAVMLDSTDRLLGIIQMIFDRKQ